MNQKQMEVRRPGQPRIDPASPLERRSVGLPKSWWKEIDSLSKEHKIKASGIVRLSIGLYLRRLGRIKTKIDLNQIRKID